MTNREKLQPNSTFVSAGRKAFLMLIHVQNNPYSLKPYRDLWEKGYRLEKRKHDAAQFPASSAPVQQKPRDIRPNRHQAPAHLRPSHMYRPAARVDRPVISESRIDRFNSKFRTKA